jgi:hypothetical protein
LRKVSTLFAKVQHTVWQRGSLYGGGA